MAITKILEDGDSQYAKRKGKYIYRIVKQDRKIKYAGTDKPSWLSLEMAKDLVDYDKGEAIYEFNAGGDPLWEVF